MSAQRVEKNIPYRSNATDEQYLDLHVPTAARNAPVALFIHGGSLNEAGERRNSPMYAGICPGLARRGIVCGTMDYRLSPSHQWPAMPDDVAAALRWLKDSIAKKGGDASRIFLVGHSSGCHLAAIVALDTIHLAAQRLSPRDVSGVVAMGCTLAPWDTVGTSLTKAQLSAAFARDVDEQRVYGSLERRLRANPMLWVGRHAPPFLVLVAESERFAPPILEEAARFVRKLRESGRPADLRILTGRRHVTTTTGFADPGDIVAGLVAAFIANPSVVTATP